MSKPQTPNSSSTSSASSTPSPPKGKGVSSLQTKFLNSLHSRSFLLIYGIAAVFFFLITISFCFNEITLQTRKRPCNCRIGEYFDGTKCVIGEGYDIDDIEAKIGNYELQDNKVSTIKAAFPQLTDEEIYLLVLINYGLYPDKDGILQDCYADVDTLMFKVIIVILFLVFTGLAFLTYFNTHNRKID